MSITLEAPAKINLSLDITGVRPNGYHEVRMVMQTITLFDTLTMSASDDISLDIEGSELKADDDNLCIRAAKLYVAETASDNEIRGLSMRLKKRIPMGAGLGGGSADAAAVLRGANVLSERSGAHPLSEDKLMELAFKLGADVPYCLAGGTKLAEGLGEILTALPDLADCHILLGKPVESASTGEIYTAYDAAKDILHPDVDAQIRAICQNDIHKVARHCGNVLTDVTIGSVPAISRIKKIMAAQGALCSEMSGSGSAVFGIFNDERDAGAAKRKLLDQMPDLFTAIVRPCAGAAWE